MKRKLWRIEEKKKLEGDKRECALKWITGDVMRIEGGWYHEK
jgi:hypothetical protein